MLSLPLAWPVLLTSAVFLLFINRVLAYYRNLVVVSYLPGPRFPFSTFTIPGALLPSSQWNPGMLLTWNERSNLYKDRSVEIFTVLGWLSGRPVMFTSSPEVAKHILGNKSGWEKLQESVNSLAPFGANLFATMQDEWPRHRRAVAPGFNTRLYASVWTETIATYYDCLATEGWDKESSFVMPDVTAVTSKFALYLIAKCGFGIDLSWNDSVGDRVNGLTLPECFEVTSKSVVLLSLLPPWMFRLPIKPLQRLTEASSALESILQGIIDKRRAAGFFVDETKTKDVFSLLLSANELEKGSKAALTDRELVSNVFLLLLAGHETTSKALAATLGLLACHPEIQQTAYEEITSVLKDGKDPTLDEFDRLPFLLGCFNEGLRMFPSVLNIMRQPLEDTVIPVPNSNGSTTTIAFKKNQAVTLDFIGLSYNARIYPSPQTFNPSRWLDPSTEPLLNFSYGPRACIGKKFALVESVGVLSLLLRDYNVSPILREGQTLQQWRAEWETNVETFVGFGHKKFPLQMTRRSTSPLA